MNKLRPIIYFSSVIALFMLIWHTGAEGRLAKLFWALPALFVGCFSDLWRTISMLERRITRLEDKLGQPQE